MKYQCVADSRCEFPVAMMCRLLKIKPSGFYAWVRRPPSRRSLENKRLRKKITEIHAESDGVYGSPKVCDELLNLGIPAGRHRVARLMRELGLKGCPKKRYRNPHFPGHTCSRLQLRENADCVLGVMCRIPPGSCG